MHRSTQKHEMVLINGKYHGVVYEHLMHLIYQYRYESFIHNIMLHEGAVPSKLSIGWPRKFNFGPLWTLSSTIGSSSNKMNFNQKCMRVVWYSFYNLSTLVDLPDHLLLDKSSWLLFLR